MYRKILSSELTLANTSTNGPRGACKSTREAPGNSVQHTEAVLGMSGRAAESCIIYCLFLGPHFPSSYFHPEAPNFLLSVGDILAMGALLSAYTDNGRFGFLAGDTHVRPRGKLDYTAVSIVTSQNISCNRARREGTPPSFPRTIIDCLQKFDQNNLPTINRNKLDDTKKRAIKLRCYTGFAGKETAPRR